MPSSTPFEQLTGVLKVYVAPVGETEPAVNAVPAGNWFLMGPTDGEHSIQNVGPLTYFTDNDHQGKVKAIRPDEDVIVRFNLVGLSLEKWARIMDRFGDLVDSAGPPAIRTMPLKRGATPNEYALLFRGDVLSPYGAFPGQFWIPRGCFDGEPQPTFSKSLRAMLACVFYALEDDTVAAADSLGHLRVQVS